MEQRNFKTIVEMAYEMFYQEQIANPNLERIIFKILSGASNIPRSLRASLYSWKRHRHLNPIRTDRFTGEDGTDRITPLSIEMSDIHKHDLSKVKIRGRFIRVTTYGDSVECYLCEETENGVIESKYAFWEEEIKYVSVLGMLYPLLEIFIDVMKTDKYKDKNVDDCGDIICYKRRWGCYEEDDEEDDEEDEE